VDEEQVGMMKPGSVLIDMAAEQGGNCVYTKEYEVVNHNGVRIVGAANMAAELPINASELFAKNLVELMKLIAPKSELVLDVNDEIVAGCLVCHEGAVRLAAG
jgi:NAD(P) transhydrogenase subunit alpha